MDTIRQNTALGQPFVLKGLFLSQKRLFASLALPLVLGGAGFLRSKGRGKLTTIEHPRRPRAGAASAYSSISAPSKTLICLPL